MSKSVRVYEIATSSLNNLKNKEIGFETVNDTDLGWKMVGGKNSSGEITKFLGKDKVARVSSMAFLSGSTVTLFSTDGTLAGNSDSTVATEKATKTYVDTEIGAIATDHGELSGLGDDDHTQYLSVDGTRGLSSNWNAGLYKITANQFESVVATGTAPFVVASTTLNTNLNADLWDGYQFSDYLDQAVKIASIPTFAGVKTGLMYPTSDSATAIKITKSDGTTPIMTFDTTDKKVLINNIAGVGTLPTGQMLGSILFSVGGTTEGDRATIEFVGANSNPGQAIGEFGFTNVMSSISDKRLGLMQFMTGGSKNMGGMRYFVNNGTGLLRAMEIFYEGKIRIGDEASSISNILDIRKDQNATTLISVNNQNAGASVRSGIIFDTINSSGYIQLYNSAFGAATLAQKFAIRAMSTSTGLFISSEHASGVIDFYIAGVAATNKVGWWSTTGLSVYGALKVNFRDTAVGIYSQAANYLDLFATTAIRIGDSSAGAPANYSKFSLTGDLSFVGSAGLYPRVLNQADIPAAGTGATQLDTSEMCIWTDTDDSKCYFCYNHGGIVKKIELI